MNFGSKIVLYVEDDPNDVVLLEHALKRAQVDLRMVTLGDGQEAIDYMSGHGIFSDRGRFPIPAIILLDLKMPRISGIDFLRWLRERPEFCSVVVIVFSSSELRSDVSAAYRMGANSFVTKPTAPDARNQLIHSLRGWWIDLNRYPAPADQ
jgi:CheY-like chemotaxis protein